MFEEVEDRRRRLALHRPSDPVTAERLNAFFEPWLIWSSNALEGNTMSLGDTVYLIREGKLPAGKREDEYLEVKGQQDAHAYVLEAVARDFRMSEKLIREVHQLLTRKLDHEKFLPGQYKDRDDQVRLADGRLFPYLSHVDTPAAMKGLVDWYLGAGADLHPIERAARFHYQFILVHPFRDGNGRTARALTNLSLMQGGYVPAIFRAGERRPVYLGALRQVDDSVPLEALAPSHPGLNLFPFVSYIEQELLWSYDRALDIVEGRLSVSPEDLVTSFVGLEREALRAVGIAPDDEARLAQMSTSVERMSEHVAGILRGVVEAANATLKEITVLLQVESHSAGEALSAAEPGSIQSLRRAALNLGDSVVRGRLAAIRLQFRKRTTGSTEVTPPPAWCEFLMFAEPHTLLLAAHVDAGMKLPAGEARPPDARIRLPLDPSAWRRADVERFLIDQTQAFLVLATTEAARLNGRS
jgi:hypothetical protein